MIIDSHAHLDDRRFDEDRDQLIDNLKQEGIDYIINIGADLESSRASLALALEHDFIYAAVGIHPHDAKTADDINLSLIKSMAKSPKVVAIGEIGLDYYYDHSPREVQREVFIKQINMAKELNLPIVIHDRDSHGDLMDILKREGKGVRGVLHCFSGSVEMAREAVKLGYYISIAGPVTFKNARKLVEVVEAIDIEKILVETDCPYLTPTPYRGQRNNPSYVRHVIEKIAEIKGLPFEEIANATSKNTLELFGIKG